MQLCNEVSRGKTYWVFVIFGTLMILCRKPAFWIKVTCPRAPIVVKTQSNSLCPQSLCRILSPRQARDTPWLQPALEQLSGARRVGHFLVKRICQSDPSSGPRRDRPGHVVLRFEVGWRPSEVIATRVEAIAFGWRPSLLGRRPSLLGWRPSHLGGGHRY